MHLGKVILTYLPTTEMPADGFTKPLIGLNFDSFVRLFGLACTPTCNKFLSKKPLAIGQSRTAKWGGVSSCPLDSDSPSCANT